MNQAVAVREQPQGGALAMWNEEQLDIITRLICPDATPTELALFGQVCQRTGLDPFAKQIYGIKRKGRLTIQTGIDGFRLTAQRSGEYAGQEGPLWCGEDGVWRDVWLLKSQPAAAKVGVFRTGWTRPVWGIATWTEYAQYSNGQPAQQWGTQPSNMLAKCAEAQALRKAFPAELSGLYGKEEMGQAENDGAPTPLPVRGELIESGPAPWIATFEDQWTKGAALARETGAVMVAKPETSDGRTVCNEALRTLAARVRARKVLLDTLSEVVGLANEAGGDFEIPADVRERENADIQSMITAAQAAIATVEA